MHSASLWNKRDLKYVLICHGNFYLDEVHCVEENLTEAVTKSEWIGRRQWQLLSRLEGLNEHCAWKDRWKKSGCWSQCDLSLSDEMPLFFQTPPVCLSSLWCPGVVQEHCQNTVRLLSAMATISSGTGTFFLSTLNSTVSVTTIRTEGSYSKCDFALYIWLSKHPILYFWRWSCQLKYSLVTMEMMIRLTQASGSGGFGDDVWSKSTSATDRVATSHHGNATTLLPLPPHY